VADEDGVDEPDRIVSEHQDEYGAGGREKYEPDSDMDLECERGRSSRSEGVE
jgi:hypothetical protein